MLDTKAVSMTASKVKYIKYFTRIVIYFFPLQREPACITKLLSDYYLNVIAGCFAGSRANYTLVTRQLKDKAIC
jgi:hypothetical protein